MLRTPAAFAHNSFAFNSHLNADGTPIKSNVPTSVSIDERQINTAYRDVRDPYHLTQGGQLGRVHKNFTTLQIGGRIFSPDRTAKKTLSDRERALMAAFDPALCLRDSPTTLGAYAFTFREPTTDATNYPSGFMDLQWFMRPLDRPRLIETIGDVGVIRYALSLIAPDPRMYEQTESSLVLSSGTPTGNVINLGNVPAALKATIVMSGAGASNFTITRAGVAFKLDLSGLTAGTVIVVFETCAPYGIGRSITRSGVSVFSRKTSDASTWLDAPVGTTSFTISNLTGITSVTLNWYSSRA